MGVTLKPLSYPQFQHQMKGNQQEQFPKQLTRVLAKVGVKLENL